MIARMLRHIQRCESTEPYYVQLIPSSRDPHLVYEVHSAMPYDPPAEYTCSCPAFQFNGTCKHQQMAWIDRCLWKEGDDETQTREQRERQICPVCGCETLKDLIDDQDED